MILEPIECPSCGGINIVKQGQSHLEQVNVGLLESIELTQEPMMVVRLEEAELDKMWSFVESKRQQR